MAGRLTGALRQGADIQLILTSSLKKSSFHTHLQERISGVFLIVLLSAFHYHWFFSLSELIIVVDKNTKNLDRLLLFTAVTELRNKRFLLIVDVHFILHHKSLIR